MIMKRRMHLYAVSFHKHGLPQIFDFPKIAAGFLKNEGTWAYM